MIDQGLPMALLVEDGMVPLVVIRPIEEFVLLSLVNHNAPSGPAVMPSGCVMPDPLKIDTVPEVVILPIEP